MGVDLDLLPSLGLARLLLEQNAQAVTAVQGALPQIAAAIDQIVPRLGAGASMHYVGAGTSGRLAVLDAVECPPTFGIPLDQVQVHMAGGAQALLSALEESEDDAGAGAEAVRGCAAHDVVVGVAASGSTPYVLGALAAAKVRGCLTVGVSCVLGSPMSAAVDMPIVLDVGPELLIGSTRLKAGTAQKIVLNMLSTGTMARLGFVFGNLMVGLQPHNEKQRQRAASIVASIAGVDVDAAHAALARCSYNLRQAVVVLVLGIAPADAAARLDAARGNLRAALLEPA